MTQFSGSTFGRYTRFWLIVTGVILLAVGGVLAATLGGVPFAGGTMVLTGAILGVVGAALIVVGVLVGRRAAATDQLLQTGIVGQGQVVGLTQTGMYLNENPQIRMNLLVSLPGQTPYAATRTEFVPLMLLGRLSSGAPLAVRVDPADFSRVVVDWGASGFAAPMAPAQTMIATAPVAAGGAPAPVAGSVSGSAIDESLNQVQAALARGGSAAAAPFASAEQGNYTIEQLREHLRQNGVQATARIDMLQDSGQVVGDERLFTMEMTLNPTTGTPQKLPASAAMVPLAKSHKLFQGMNVPVRYETSNPNLLMVEWDKV